MTQNDLYRAVARSTGETVSEISRRGFQPLTPGPVECDAEITPIDWDELERERQVALIEQRQSPAVA